MSGLTRDTVPGRLSRGFDTAGNGELFWWGDRAAAAATWIATEGFALVGGEIYRRHHVGWATYLRSWTTLPERDSDEAWEAWVARGLSQALEAIVAASALEESDGREPRGLRIFFAVQAGER